MIKTKLTEDMKHYMKEKEKVALSGIRMAIAAIKNKEIEVRHELDDNEVIAVLKRQVKEHKESLEFVKDDEAKKELEIYIEVLSKYIPADMDKNEADKIIRELLTAANITEKKQMGDAMKTVMPVLKGKLDGKVIKEIVSTILK